MYETQGTLYSILYSSDGLIFAIRVRLTQLKIGRQLVSEGWFISSKVALITFCLSPFPKQETKAAIPSYPAVPNPTRCSVLWMEVFLNLLWSTSLCTEHGGYFYLILCMYMQFSTFV